jgi:hypothetical protein
VNRLFSHCKLYARVSRSVAQLASTGPVLSLGEQGGRLGRQISGGGTVGYAKNIFLIFQPLVIKFIEY